MTHIETEAERVDEPEAESRTQPREIRIDPNGNEAQAAFVEADTKETVYFGGVGSGKTVGGIMRLARHIYQWNPGERLAVVTPTVPMLRNVIIPELRKWKLLGVEGVEHYRSENRIEYPNGTEVILESANNDRKIERLRGLNIAGAWLDEVSQHKEKTYEVLGDRLRTGEYRNLWATGTPKGKNWAYDAFVAGVRESGPTFSRPVEGGTLIADDHTTTIYGVTTAANRATPDDYVESRERQHTGRSYEQEILGEFVDYEGLVYPWFDDSNVTDIPDHYTEVIYGADFGHNNPAVVLAIARTGSVWTVIDEWYQRRVTVNDQAHAAEDMLERWGNGTIYCDPSEPANIETFRRNGLPAEAAENDVTPGIQTVSSYADSLYVAEHCKNLRSEFGQYKYRDGGDADKPLKQNDHALDALRYGLYTHDIEAGGDGWMVTRT